MSRPRAWEALDGGVQVAGVADLSEAEMLVEAGVDFVGLPLRLPDGREDLSEAAAGELVAALGERARCVLITYQNRADEISTFADQLGCSWVQLHGRISPDEVMRLRQLRPDLHLILALVIRPGEAGAALARMAMLEAHVDAWITDTFDPVTRRRGATGLTHDWEVSAQIVAATDLPVILAGGLGPDNVAEAVAAVGSAAVDAHTRLESPDGGKDPQRVRAFVQAARAAFAGREPS